MKMKDGFVRSIGVLISGSLLAQVFNVITMPIMTRLYTPEDIGYYTYFITLVYLFLPVINGRYELLIVTLKDKLYVLVKLCFMICVVLTILITVGTVVYLSFVPGGDKYISYIWCMPILLLIAGCISVLEAYNNRQKEYVLLSRVMMNRSIVQFLSISILGWMNFACLGLLVSHLLSQCVSLGRQSSSLKNHFKDIWNVNFKEVVRTAKLYWRQPFYSGLASFVNSYSYSVLNFLIAALFGNAVLGYYFLSFKILGMPLSLVSQNVSRVFFEEAAREYDLNGKFSASYMKTTRFLVYVSIPSAVVVYLIAPYVCEWFFGEGWRVAGEYVQILVPMFAMRFIASPLSLGIIIRQKNHMELLLQTGFILGAIGVYAVVVFYNIDIKGFLAGISGVYSLVYIAFWGYTYRISR